MMPWSRAALGLILLAAVNVSAQDTATNAFPPEQVKRGATLYQTNCSACHGPRMSGSEWAIDLKTFPRDNRARFVDSVTHGKNTMPPWGDVLSPEEIGALWAYVVAGEPR